MINIDNIKKDFEENGYVVIPDILTPKEITECRNEFFKWLNSIPNLNEIHKIIDFNGIFKYYQVGHQRFAWLLRTNPKIINIFKKLWDTDELVCSFDGCCYYSPDYMGNPHYWTHTDQISTQKGLHCIQSFLSLTDNKERTLIVYQGSHKLHEEYFKNCNDMTSFNIIDEAYIHQIENKKKYLNVKAGSLVLWDSRTFHQNTCGRPTCEEERLVQYLCYLPKNNFDNRMGHHHRMDFYNNLRTTGHCPYPLSAIPLQPNSYNSLYNDNFVINYSELPKPDLSDLQEKINKLL